MPITDRLRKPFLLVTAITVSSLLAACSGTEPPPSPNTAPVPTRSLALALTATPIADTESTINPKDLTELPFKLKDSPIKLAVRKEDEKLIENQAFTFVQFATPLSAASAAAMEVPAGAIRVYAVAETAKSAATLSGLSLAGYAFIAVKASIDVAGPYYVQNWIEGPTQVPVFSSDGKLVGYNWIDTFRGTTRVESVIRVNAQDASDLAKVMEKVAETQNINPTPEAENKYQIALIEGNTDTISMFMFRLPDRIPGGAKITPYLNCESLIMELGVDQMLNYDLYLTDFSIREGAMTGDLCVGAIRKIRPGAKVVGMSTNQWRKNEFQAAQADGFYFKDDSLKSLVGLIQTLLK